MIGSLAQLVEHLPYKQMVIGSSPIVPTSTYCVLYKREWLSGRASPCQGECREFESRLPLHFLLSMAPWPSGKAQVCKTFIPQFKSGWRLHCRSGGIGRRKGLKILRAAMPVRVQVPPSAPYTTFNKKINLRP